MRTVQILLLTMLAGCASRQPATVEVRVPVYVPCATGAPLTPPAFEFNTLGPTATDGEKVLALARDWPRGRKYEMKLQAALEGCR